ncbi:MAG: hypothetical protein H6Q36_1304 [Chloroflexi bacterium]|nr:hypothetical protein [Chloroflexota bacterium]
MPAEIPDGIAIEPIFFVEATYSPDAAERRPAFRAEHLVRIAALRNSGVIVEAGGLADFSRSVLLLRAADVAAAEAIARDDVYFRNGIWVEVRAHPLGRVCRPGELPAG